MKNKLKGYLKNLESRVKVEVKREKKRKKKVHRHQTRGQNATHIIVRGRDCQNDSNYTKKVHH
jgi:hypothetical protein